MLFSANSIHTLTFTHGACVHGPNPVELIDVSLYGNGIAGLVRGEGCTMFVPWSSIANVTVS